MFRRTLYRSAAALVALGLLASACSSDDDAGDDEDGDAAPSRTTLEIAVTGDTTDLVPFTVVSGPKLLLFDALFTPLLGMNNENEIYSDLLESWEVSDDAQTVTLTLRPDIEWSDGTPVTSADVVMSLTQQLDSNISVQAGRIGGVAGQQAYSDGDADSISGLSAPDEHTVVVELAEPDAAWLPNLAVLGRNMPILPEHILGDVPHEELTEHEYFSTFPVVNGPYQFVDVVHDQHIQLERNPNWSLGEAGFEQVFYKVVQADVQSAQLETGEVQLISGVEPTDADRIGATEGVEVESTPGVAPLVWVLLQYEPIDDPRVRQAMIHAIDREGICESVYNGYCTVPTTNMRQIAPEWSIPTEDVIDYTYDPERARELLDEAGWDPDNKLTFYILTDSRTDTTAVEIAQDNMADVGINWTVENVDGGVLIESLEERPGEDFLGFWQGGANFTVDPSNVQEYTQCDRAFPAGANLAHYCDPELDELWAAGRRTTDQEERAEIYHEAFRILNQNPAEISFFVRDTIVAHDSRLEGFKIHPDVGAPTWNIGEWTWSE